MSAFFKSLIVPILLLIGLFLLQAFLAGGVGTLAR